jgi:hypothetical protein
MCGYAEDDKMTLADVPDLHNAILSATLDLPGWVTGVSIKVATRLGGVEVTIYRGNERAMRLLPESLNDSPQVLKLVATEFVFLAAAIPPSNNKVRWA